uniref:Protein kinase domain-containing protein n=1 Tax=Mastacembelus armatus TaxID=205130 RepID=A0A7N8YHZ0_9TELE
MGNIPKGSCEEKPCFTIKEDDFLFSKKHEYKVQKFLGEGTFGKVAQCLNSDTMKQMAVKIVRNDLDWAGRRELAMFDQLKKLDQDKNNLVRFIEHFKHKRYVCLAFELLDIDLFTFMEKRDFEPMHVCDIQSITQQMLVALNALKSIGLVHTDIKPDNIMLVDHKLHPLRVKLIDFGLASKVSELWCGCTIQPYGYRAPEVILGLPLNEAIDMWSLGCVLSAIKTKNFFTKDPDSSWRLKTEDEYVHTEDDYTIKFRSFFHRCTSLNDILKTRPESIKDGSSSKDRQAFSSLLKNMLNVDSEKRITPSKALQHSFISRKQFSHYSKQSQMEQSTNKWCYVFLTLIFGTTALAASGKCFNMFTSQLLTLPAFPATGHKVDDTK